MQLIFRSSCRAIVCGSTTCIAALLMIAACSDRPAEKPVAVGACGVDGLFTAELYGGLELALDWPSDRLECQGMPRPNGAGARLRFAGPAGTGADVPTLAFILGLPDLERGKTARELPTNVTVIDESKSRFFATQASESCWTDIDRHEATGNPAHNASEYVVGGILYCVSPLAEIHGPGSLRFSEIRFVGLIDWKEPQ